MLQRIAVDRTTEGSHGIDMRPEGPMRDRDTLWADLATLFGEAGIHDIDLERAVADEHVRLAGYLDVIAVVTADRCRDRDRAIVACIMRDPYGSAAKTAVVALIDAVAQTMDEPDDFRGWTAGLVPEVDRLATPHRTFVHRRIHDWTTYLTMAAGHTVLSAAELATLTDWMQRRIATESSSPVVLTLVADAGSTRKIRNIARSRIARQAAAHGHETSSGTS